MQDGDIKKIYSLLDLYADRIACLEKKLDSLMMILAGNLKISGESGKNILDLLEKNQEFLKVLLANQLLDEIDIQCQTSKKKTNKKTSNGHHFNILRVISKQI